MHRNKFLRGLPIRIALALCTAVLAVQSACAAQACTKVILEGDVNAGKEWKAPMGEGWVFRIVPIPPLKAGYAGWDLVVDRDQPAGFPDALYLATPPYRSISEREIGTTYGLRAQDAIGWNPRSFRFLADPPAFRQAQQLYLSGLTGDSEHGSEDRGTMSRLLDLEKGAAQGQLRILDAHLSPGVADPAPFAQRWAVAGARMQHETDASAAGSSSARGALSWMRFRLTLWLPPNWKPAPGLHPARAACGQ
jgi:hypothetical protein